MRVKTSICSGGLFLPVLGINGRAGAYMCFVRSASAGNRRQAKNLQVCASPPLQLEYGYKASHAHHVENMPCPPACVTFPVGGRKR